MSLSKPKITLPTSQETNDKVNIIKEVKSTVKIQYEAIVPYQNIDITKSNIKEVEGLVYAAEDLISNYMDDDIYSGNRDQYYVNLIYIVHKLSLKIETYKLELKIDLLDAKSKDIDKIQKELSDKQDKAEEQSSNMIYNILGFIASFSVVSASVAAIDKINGTINVLLFMTFTAFILITTLIALNNFYKVRVTRPTKLQDNYFLWKLLIVVIIGLVLYKALIYIRNNEERLFQYVGQGIYSEMNK